jgi:hypothetical protein
LNGYDGQGGVVKRLFVVVLSAPYNDVDPGLPGFDPAHETDWCQVREIMDNIARAGGSPGALPARDRQELRDHIESIVSEIALDG